MKNISYKKAGLLFFLLALGCTTIFAYTKLKDLPAKSIANTWDVLKVDTVKLKLFLKVYENLDVSREEFLIKGKISFADGADTSQNATNVPYIYSRKGELMYLKFGDTEFYNTAVISINVDHQNKRILLSKNKAVISSAALPTFDHFTAEEGYEVKTNRFADQETISLINPTHLSCKEYNLAFDPSTLQPKIFQCRLSNFSEPENDKLDKKIKFAFDETSKKSAISTFLSKDIVVKKNGTWELSTAFNGYELINTL